LDQTDKRRDGSDIVPFLISFHENRVMIILRKDQTDIGNRHDTQSDEEVCHGAHNSEVFRWGCLNDRHRSASSQNASTEAIQDSTNDHSRKCKELKQDAGKDVDYVARELGTTTATSDSKSAEHGAQG